jgi:hypothetical protein
MVRVISAVGSCDSGCAGLVRAAGVPGSGIASPVGDVVRLISLKQLRALRPRSVLVFSNEIPIDIKSLRALVVRP